MTPPNVQFIPAVTSNYETLGTCTGWQINPYQPIRRSIGYTAGSSGLGTTQVDIRSDGFVGFIYFVDATARSNWQSLFSGYTTFRVTDGNSNVYENVSCTFNTFTSTTVSLGGSWTGTLPTNTASIIEIAP
jgi:hypothetical protein